MFPSLAVANEFLSLSFKDAQLISPMKLLKLVYLAHGWHLALTDRPLINESVEAWKYGPVVPGLYDEVKEYGNTDITELLRERNFDDLSCEIPRINRETEDGQEAMEVIKRVWDVYSHYSAIQLSNLTHQPGTPWFEVYMPMKDAPIFNTDIPADLIKQRFREYAQQ